MNYSILLSSLAILLLVTQSSDATLKQRLLRRQTNEDSGPESTTTPTSSNTQQTQPQTPSRLYPDLPRPPTVAFVPQFGAPNNGPNNGQAPFVPFGHMGQMGQVGINNRFGEPPFRPMQPVVRQMTPSERLQSQTFTNGLGRRLLSLMGIGSYNETSSPANTEDTTTTTDGPTKPTHNSMEDTMKALQNSTVLRQLNSGVQSVYGSLSRMYNSTVQQQLDLLQERYMKMASNSSDPWQQRMAQQVPQYFRSMAMKVNEAQENLNRVWRQLAQAATNNNNSTTATSANNNNNNAGVPMGATSQAQMMNTRSSNSFDPNMMMGGNMDNPGGFMNQIGRSFGFGGDGSMMMDDPLNPRQDMVSKLMDFWHNQVQPQMSIVRGQMMRIWRDLTQSGALRPGMQMMGGNRGASRGNGDMGGSSGGNNSNDIVDDVLKDIEMNEPEFKLVDSKTGNESQPPAMMPKVQNGVVTMQRELNQLWNGLTNSIMNAMNMMSARRRNMMNGNNNNDQEMDPVENEISDRVKGLTKLQKDADVVYETVQRQQQQQQQQQRPSFTDRFMNFFGNMDFAGNMDQLGNRVGDSVSRFGNMIGDIWN